MHHNTIRAGLLLTPDGAERRRSPHSEAESLCGRPLLANRPEEGKLKQMSLPEMKKMK